MKDEKELVGQEQDSEKEEYSFLQEVIKEEAGDRKKWRHDVLRRIKLGIIFGLVACFTFLRADHGSRSNLKAIRLR